MIVVRDTYQQSFLMKCKSCIETIRIEDGVVYNLPYHQKRFEKTQTELYNTHTHQNLSSLITPPQKGLYRCRITYNQDIQNIEYFNYIPKDIKSLQCIECNDIEYSFKYSCREKLNELLEQSRCDEIIIIKNGLVTDTTISNIAFLKDDTWYTPKTPLLEGTARAFLIDNHMLHPTDITLQDISSFSKIAVFNAMVGFRVLDGVKLKQP